MHKHNNKNKNSSIADKLEKTILPFSLLEKNNISQSLTTIKNGLSRIDEIAQEYKANVLRALTHWMTLNTEVNENNKDKIKTLLENDCYSNWIEILVALLREHDTHLLSVLHQSLTVPDWPTKPSAPLLKNVINWIEETRVENLEYLKNTLSSESNNVTDNSDSELNLEDNFTPEVLEEFTENTDFTKPLVTTEKSSLLNKELSDNNSETILVENNENSINEPALINEEEISNERSDFSTEVNNIVISLTSIATSSSNPLSNIDKYINQLQRLTLFAEISSYQAIRYVSEWCERNLRLFGENQTEKTLNFITSGACWSWIEHINTCIVEPKEVSHLAVLATELQRKEWLEAIDTDELQALLLCLRNGQEQASGSVNKLDDDINSRLNLNTTGVFLQQTESNIPLLNTLVGEKQNVKQIETSGLQLNWDDDTHPELLMVYLEETPTQITQLSLLMNKISENQDQVSKEDKHTAARMAHSIKGDSAIVGITALAEYSYKLETLLDYAVNHDLPKELLELLPDAAKCLESLFDALQTQQAEPEEFLPIFTKLTHFAGNLNEGEDNSVEEPSNDSTESKEPQANDQFIDNTAMNIEKTDESIISWDNDVHPELLSTYFQETPDQISEAADLLHKIAKGESNHAEHKKAARIAHTIKGASSVVGLNSLVALTHNLEDILNFSVNNELPTETSDLLREASDCMENLFENIQNKQAEPEEFPSVLARLSQYTDSLNSDGEITDYSLDTNRLELPDFIKDDIVSSENFSKTINTSKNQLLNQTHIRVPINVIDKLLNLAGELVTASTQVSDHLEKAINTNKQVKIQDVRIHKMLDELSKTIFQQEKNQTNMLSSLQESNFDSLEMDTYNELHSVAGLLTESILDNEEIEKIFNNQLNDLDEDLRSLNKLNKELSEVILKSRMVSLNTLVPRLERIVRQTCRKTGKQAKLIITGNDINIDTNILNGLVDPLLHLLRNAIDHGIELADIRNNKNKNVEGKIELSFTQEGNSLLMQLKDDGAGIDPEKIYQKAIEKGMITATQEFSKNDTLKLILKPGFSTQDTINDISGRGVGMDVVNSSVEALKGTLQITSDLEKGTTFNLKIPLTLITNTVLLVSVAGNPVAIPTDSIDQIIYLSAVDVIERDGSHYVCHEDQELPIKSLSNLLKWSSDEIDFSVSNTLLLINSEDQVHAVHIEQIITSREVVVKNLDPWINPTKGVVGACHLHSGEVASVLNLALVIKRTANDQTKTDEKPSIPVLTKHTPQILVVDDSLSNRKALSLIIDQTEYDVVTAVDGLDALQIMNEKTIDLVFTDLEMPRMNGLELTQAIRAWSDKKQTPIVMITSRTTSKHRKLAAKVGVDDYLTKPVVIKTLLESIETWLKLTETA